MTRTGGWWLALFLAIAPATRAADRDLRLVDAVRRADAPSVRALLKELPKRTLDVNARDGSGATALHWAVYQNDQDTASVLIRSGAHVNAANDLGITPLRLAVVNSSAAMVARLLDAGADPNVTPATDGTPLMVASRIGNAEVVKLLVAHGADVNARESEHQQSALMWAVAERHPEVARVLIEGGGDVQARTKVWRRPALLCCQEYESEDEGGVEVDEGGYTPLLFAAREGDVESGRMLLAAGAKVNDAAAVGTSVLVVAAQSGQGAFAALLLDKGADPNAAEAGYTALHAAALRGDVDLVKALLAHGANPNARQMKGSEAPRWNTFAFDKLMIGATPFLLATRSSRLDVMRALAAGGADVNLPLADGKTPVMAAALRIRTFNVSRHEERALPAIALAIELGSTVTAADHDGNTALHQAAARRLDKVIPLLVQHGAVLNARNSKGETPLAATLASIPPPKNAGNEPRNEYDDLRRHTDGTAALLRTLGATE